MHARDVGRILQLAQRRQQHAGANRQQQHAQRQRRAGLEALVAVGVVGVGVFRAVVAGQQHDEVGDQVRQRMNAVGDQALRAREQADRDLHAAQPQVDADADPGAAPRRGGALGGRVAGVLGVLESGFAHRRVAN
ncbi:hypothetical protein GALL_455210 [mine drainage metagenome]|uniref:Uncharacterized protein n=1 Tax=mine drainage metagenome TaxID=410659 RepID=A0A1J5PNV9_9ZZZZ